jgi:hypothetical protein
MMPLLLLSDNGGSPLVMTDQGQLAYHMMGGKAPKRCCVHMVDNQ